MFENVDGRTDGRTTDGRTTDGRTTDARVTGILIAHLGAFGSGELKNQVALKKYNFMHFERRIRLSKCKKKKKFPRKKKKIKKNMCDHPNFDLSLYLHLFYVCKQ